ITVRAWPDPVCRTPPLAPGYTIDQYAGTWYEIGKIQTAGGAIFEKSCVCTSIHVAPIGDRKVIVTNTCNRETPQGKLLIFNETLTTDDVIPTGRYNETFRSLAYNIIALKSDEYSVEYDCMHTFGITNYCVHILSRKPTLSDDTVKMLLNLAVEYDLNTAKLEYEQTLQQGCTYGANTLI
ncbi:unnamed protein product, partial [Didymodactylos carnosus]